MRTKTTCRCAVILSAAVFALACGQSHGDPRSVDASVTDASTRTDAGTGAPTGTLVAACPPSAPRSGDACGSPRLSCEYGDDWSARCNTLAQCWVGGVLDGTWEVRAPSADCPTSVAPPASCPVTRPSGACSDADPTDLCVYGAARCTCYASTDIRGMTYQQWWCSETPVASCPSERPRIGSACSADGLTCRYSVCDRGGWTYCSDGVWTEGIAGDSCAADMG